MNSKTKLILFCLILVLFNVAAVSASDTNLTDDNHLKSVDQGNETDFIKLNYDYEQINTIQLDDVNSSSDNSNASSNGNSSVNLKSANNNNEKYDVTLTPVDKTVFLGKSFNVVFKDQLNRT